MQAGDREMRVPRAILECDNVGEFMQNRVVLAWSGSQGRDALVWDVFRLGPDDTWADVRWDLETACGAAGPRDCVFGFEVLAQTPRGPRAGREAAVLRMLTAAHGRAAVPPLASLKQLAGTEFLGGGKWIVIVRLPRPAGARNPVPFNRREDVKQLLASGAEDAAARLQVIRAKLAKETHPAEIPWHVTRHAAALQPPHAGHVCMRCNAVGHHATTAHDEYEEHFRREPSKTERMITHLPTWLRREELGRERLAVPQLEEGKGFTIEVRHTTAQIPLRLARALKLRGMQVQGAVPVCGVATRMETD